MKYSMKIFISFILFSNTVCTFASDKPAKTHTGAFGVCSCQPKADAPKMIELLIKEDNTFSYTDNSNPNKPLVLSGTWVAKGNKVQLVTADKNRSFHRKWKFNDNGQCITSRYMLNFRRICLMEKC